MKKIKNVLSVVFILFIGVFTLSASDMQSFEREVIKISESAKKSVASIRVERESRGIQDPFFDFLRQFGFKGAPQPYNPKREGMGTGFVIDEKDGYLVTNNHVIAKADSIEITIDGKKFKGQLVGSDPQTDIGLVKIEGFKKGDIQALKLANSDDIKVGSFAIAIGNPFGLNHTVTFGIVSAKGRSGMNVTEYEDFIQTDAAINPGNSGGPLINTNGEVIGMNTAIFSRSGGYMGIGFAVPSSMIKEITTQLISGKKIQRAVMGVVIQELDDNLRNYFKIQKGVSGVLVGSVAKESPAEKGGIQSGDVITKFNNKPTETVSKLKNAVGFSPFDKKLPVELIRKGKTVKVHVILKKEFLLSESGFALDEEVADELGLTLANESGGVVVSKVDLNSLAFTAGIMEGDIIVTVNGTKVKSVSHALNLVGKSKSVLFLVNRKGREFLIAINR
ncbi:MAG: trypsin-like peptidase domain-containing protein [bacterium]